MKLHRLLVAVPFVVALVPSAGPAAASTSPVRITAIYFDSPGPDTGSNASLNAEWVQVKNFSTTTRTLTGWTLLDAQNHLYRFPTFRLARGASVRVHTGTGTNTATNLYWRQHWYIWNNTGDTARLRNSAGTLMSRCTYMHAQDPLAYC
jgi:hypothetical protein